MTKNEKIIDQILTDQDGKYSADKNSVTIKIKSTEYRFKSFSMNSETVWYFTSISTYGNTSSVYGDDVNATGYQLKNDQEETVSMVHQFLKTVTK
tara:strand:- start:2983 stop:3267 length:285 start_codon:yes stop_codon:yes gene_type:complete